MFEIEVKAKLKDRGGVVAQLIARGCTFSEPITQEDVVYVRTPGDIQTYLANDSFVRIRIQNDGRVLLTVKKPRTKSPSDLVKHEAEIFADSSSEAARMLELMGYTKTVRTKKVRKTADLQGLHICIDSIEGLGDFIELEQMGHERDAVLIQERMRDFLVSLKIPAEDEVTRGYDILMLEKTL